MLIKQWNDLPDFMRTEEVCYYHRLLKKKVFSLLIKRVFDIILSILLIVLLSPILLILAILIKLDSEGPIFYRQERVTQYGKVFKIFKFRTMVNHADKKGSLITSQDDKRITSIGKKIRDYRLDEIPQLFNVLCGEMTFVGTRPEVKKYVDVYTDEMNATLLLPAGITSIASIRFKDEDEIIEKHRSSDIDEVYTHIIMPKKMKYNLEYLEEFSIFVDLKVCIETIFEVCMK